MLLCSLRASYETALEFDCRPGLKFLVQKVAQLKSAANLYKQAGAAWSLIAMTLFEVCVTRVRAFAKEDERAVSTERIKRALEGQQRDRNTAHGFTSCDVTRDSGGAREGAAGGLLAPEVGLAFFVDLHNLFVDICELYIDILVDKDGAR